MPWPPLSMGAARAGGGLADALLRVAAEPTVITTDGAPVAVVVSYDFFERAMEALEDLADIAAADAALAEAANSIPWAQVKADRP